MFTREHYLKCDGDRFAAHRRYYGEIVTAAGGHRAFHMPDQIATIREALRSDPHMNSIPLHQWDKCVPPVISAAIAKAFRERGDYPTHAGLVCLVKEAARLKCEEIDKLRHDKPTPSATLRNLHE